MPSKRRSSPETKTATYMLNVRLTEEQGMRFAALKTHRGNVGGADLIGELIDLAYEKDQDEIRATAIHDKLQEVHKLGSALVAVCGPDVIKPGALESIETNMRMLEPYLGSSETIPTHGYVPGGGY